MSLLRKSEISRILELADVGARQASEAFSQILGQPIRNEAAVVVEGGFSANFHFPAPSGCEASTGVLFELEGCLDAVVGILFPHTATGGGLVRQLVSSEFAEIEPAVIESALTEVGNILASHIASAIADELSLRLLPSIPSLAMVDAEEVLQARIEAAAGVDPLRIESALVDQDGMEAGRLILVPTRLSESTANEAGSESVDV